jgi:hypothetical protein
MSEPTPLPPPPPAPAPAPVVPQRPEGSFAAGYFGGAIAMFLSLVVTVGLASLVPRLGALFLLLPVACLVGLIVYCIKDGKRTIKGLVAMILTFVGLLVLLVAACFGYFAIHPLNFH